MKTLHEVWPAVTRPKLVAFATLLGSLTSCGGSAPMLASGHAPEPDKEPAVGPDESRAAADERFHVAAVGNAPAPHLPGAPPLCRADQRLFLCGTGWAWQGDEFREDPFGYPISARGPSDNAWATSTFGGRGEVRIERLERGAWGEVFRVDVPRLRVLATGVGESAGVAHVDPILGPKKWLGHGLDSRVLERLRSERAEVFDMWGLSDGSIVLEFISVSETKLIRPDGSVANYGLPCANEGPVPTQVLDGGQYIAGCRDRTGRTVMFERSRNGALRTLQIPVLPGEVVRSIHVAENGDVWVVVSNIDDYWGTDSLERRLEDSARVLHHSASSQWSRVRLPRYAGWRVQPVAAVTAAGGVWVAGHVALPGDDLCGRGRDCDFGVVFTDLPVRRSCHLGRRTCGEGSKQQKPPRGPTNAAK